MIIFISCHESLPLEGRLCVTLLCEKEGKEHGKKLYLSICNGKWLMDFHGSLLVFGFI
jgi:hypothetical protein